jgi:hypothetical protein
MRAATPECVCPSLSLSLSLSGHVDVKVDGGEVRVRVWVEGEEEEEEEEGDGGQFRRKANVLLECNRNKLPVNAKEKTKSVQKSTSREMIFRDNSLYAMTFLFYCNIYSPKQCSGSIRETIEIILGSHTHSMGEL